ncbi:ABC transporter substrate-binding protein [Pseudomonas oryzihabitans]|uniref:Fe3+-hydroxamate ABC transporter substrate-binding protein n=1 Tax=Pseudomonas oryzihabitans TaxID=47885 RepID=A0A2Z5AAA8_9PSED|nr:ABC transporter substrate-binding protein [Pseudomonas oryzihabitans]AXA67765.1 Fe3+-hydroxamate ABC transporter substrate-binding protein [Pseudomonas oryzihabitans]
MIFARRQLVKGLLGGALLSTLPPLFAAPAQQARIVAINWAALETLLALGVIPLAGSDTGYYRRRMPTFALPAQVQDIGPFWEPNLELLQRLQPSLILSDPLAPVVDRALRSIAPTEIVDLYPSADPYARASALLLTLGARLDRLQEAQAYLAEVDRRLGALAARLTASPRPPVQVALVNADGRHATLYGRGSLIQAVLERLGLRNAWQGRSNAMGVTLVGIERLAETPEALLVCVELPTRLAKLQHLRQDGTLWQALPAVRAGRVLTLPRFFPYGGVASALFLAEQLTLHLEGVGHV